MLEHQHVGDLTGAGPTADLLLPEGRPLSYLRLDGLAGQGMSLARALLEQRATEFRRRIPLACFTGPDRDEIGAILDRFGVSPVYPVLRGRSDGGSAVNICWLDRVQLLAMGQGLERGFRPADRAVAVGDLKLSPVYTVASPEDGRSQGQRPQPDRRRGRQPRLAGSDRADRDGGGTSPSPDRLDRRDPGPVPGRVARGQGDPGDPVGN